MTRIFITTLAVLLSLTAPASAQYIWTGTSSNWNHTFNWSPNGVPNSPTATASFTGNGLGGISIHSNVQTQSLSFSNPTGNYTIISNTAGVSLSGVTAINVAAAVTGTQTINLANIAAGSLLFPSGSNMTITNNSTAAGTTLVIGPDTVIGTPGIGGVYVDGVGTTTISGSFSTVPANAVVGGLHKNGTGTLILSNPANSYTGGTFVNAGTLLLGSGTAIPTGTNVTVASGAEFNIGPWANFAGSAIGTVTLNGGGFRVPSGNGDYYLNKLTMTGGTVDFTGTSNFWLHFTGAGAGITINPGANTWTGTGSSRIQNDTAATLDITMTNGATLYNFAILANGALGKGFRLTGAPNTVSTMLLGNPGNTADLTVDSTGYLYVADMANLGSGVLTLQNTAGDFRPGTLWYAGGTSSSSQPITLGVGGGQIYVSAGINLTLSGTIGESSPGQPLLVSGNTVPQLPHTLTLTGANTFMGPLTVAYLGTLSVGTIANGGIASPQGKSSSAPGNLKIGHPDLFGGTLQYTGPTASTDRGMTLVAFANSSYTNVNAVEVTGAATNVTFTGQVTGTGGLTKTGPGTLTLSGATNNYAGGTFVEAGRLTLGAGTAIPAGSNVTVAAGAELNFGGSVPGNGLANAIGTVTLNGGALRDMSGGSRSYYLNKLVTNGAGGTLDFVGTYPTFVNAGAGITVNGNSTWTGPFLGYFANASGAEMPITIAPNVTITTNITPASLIPSASNPFRVTGGGTLHLINLPGISNGAVVRVNQARLRMDYIGQVQPGAFDLTLDAGTLAYDSPTVTAPTSFTLGSGGGTLEVMNAATTLTVTGAINGSSVAPLTKAGPGTLVLTNLSNTYLGGLIVSAGRLDVGDDAHLGLASPTVNAAGTLRYTANSTTARTFTLNNGSLEAPSGLTLDGATINGGFLRGASTFSLTGGTALNGVTTFTSTTMNVTGPASANNFSNNGTVIVAGSQTFSMNYATNGAAGLFTVNGTANVSDFVSYGRTAINPGGALNSTQGGIVFGGGSVSNIGIYNPANGQVTPGGVLNFGSGNMRVQGGLVRNNGIITGTGDLIIDFGGVVRGAGEIDTPRAPIRINGGQLIAGNSPGLTRVSNFSLVSTGVTGGDFSNATGIAGPPIGSTGTQLSGWSVFEFGNMDNTGGSARVEGTPAARAIWQFRTVVDGGDYSTAGVPANFNHMQSYIWNIVRPRSAADVGNPNNTIPTNTVAQISIFDTATMTTVALTNANLNAYLRFDDTLWNWGAVPINERGTFAFTLLADGLGAPNRVIGVTYTPVPEPAFVLAVGGLGVAAWGAWRRSRCKLKRICATICPW